MLVVEDSPVAREFLVHVLQRDAGIQVIGTARNGEEAVAFLRERKPDVITMDINMPKMDGFETTRRIMETSPVPVVIVTATTNPRQVATMFRAVEAGAVAVLPIPTGIGHPEHAQTAGELIQTVKLMSEIKVVKRWPKTGTLRGSPGNKQKIMSQPARVVAIGASTGGPPVLQAILSTLPGDFPLPVLIVQHIASGFVQGFVEWLATTSTHPIRIANHGDKVMPGHIYVAPDNRHMTVTTNGTILLTDDPPENGLRPAVSRLFHSVAKAFGPNAIGILLTGMGSDGAQELKEMRNAGAVTIAQSAETCVVNGMPGAAVKLEAATHVLAPDAISPLLSSLVKRK